MKRCFNSMAINPYTLNNLYNQGILDYAPYDLCNGGINVNSLDGMQNPYLNAAMQGNLYRNSNISDSFGFSTPQAQNAGVDAFGGINGNIISNNSPAGINAFGGGMDKVTGTISNGFYKANAIVDKTPTLVKGIISGALILGSIGLCLKCKKKPMIDKSLQNSNPWWKFWKK